MAEMNYELGLLDGSTFKIFKGVYNDFKEKEEGIDCFQRAELLVYKEVPLRFVSKIYFGSEKHMKDFLSKLTLEQRKRAINRCEINKELFFGGDDK